MKQKNNINGWLVIDKPLGLTSTQVGSKLKQFLRPKKIGHIGTLDPLASGVLTFALGEATKLIPYWNISTKQYTFHVTFGERRATDDAEGEIIERSTVLPTLARIEHFLGQFMGIIEQIPPNYSAIQMGGKRSYARARDGENFILPARQVRVDELRLTRQITEDTFEFNVTCGKGTYVRSLARDIADACGTVGYVSYLRRIKDGCFSITDATPLDMFLNNTQLDILLEMPHKIGHNHFGIFPLSSVLDDIPAVTVGEDDLKRLLLGQAISVDLVHDVSPRVVQIRDKSRLCAMGLIENGQLKPKRLLHLGEHDVDYT